MMADGRRRVGFGQINIPLCPCFLKIPAHYGYSYYKEVEQLSRPYSPILQ